MCIGSLSSLAIESLNGLCKSTRSGNIQDSSLSTDLIRPSFFRDAISSDRSFVSCHIFRFIFISLLSLYFSTLLRSLVLLVPHLATVLFVVLVVRDQRGEEAELFGHGDLDVSGVQVGVLSLLATRIVDGQELDLEPVDRAGEQEPDRKQVGVSLAEGPGDGVQVLVAGVADQDRLNRGPRTEGPVLELDEGFAVGIGALGEDEDLEAGGLRGRGLEVIVGTGVAELGVGAPTLSGVIE